MRDRLGTAAWLNLAPRNPTQTRWTRLVRQFKTPLADRETMFTRSKAAFGETKKSAARSIYDKYFRPLEGR